MKCPTCPEATLVMSDRQGVEIDYCPACRGIWLDRGELDKLLERAANAVAPASRPTPRARPHADFDDSDDLQLPRHPRSHKKSWLSEIFD